MFGWIPSGNNHLNSFIIHLQSPYPLIQNSFAAGPGLFIPDPEQIQVVYQQLQEKDSSTPFPYWARVWPAAKAMAAYLLENPALIDQKKVLELGAGTGLPSFCIAARAKEVTISDQDAMAVALMEKNIAALGLINTRALQLDWNQYPPGLKADIILLSDINYAPADFNSLLILIQQWLQQGSTILLSTPQRIMAIPFVHELQPFIRLQTAMEIDEPEGKIPISLLLLQQEEPVV